MAWSWLHHVKTVGVYTYLQSHRVDLSAHTDGFDVRLRWEQADTEAPVWSLAWAQHTWAWLPLHLSSARPNAPSLSSPVDNGRNKEVKALHRAVLTGDARSLSLHWGKQKKGKERERRACFHFLRAVRQKGREGREEGKTRKRGKGEKAE